MMDRKHLKDILSMMNASERMDWFSSIMGFAEGSLLYYEVLARLYDDILRVELIRGPFTKLRIVCKPDYNISNVLDFTREIFLELDYEIVVENEPDLIR